MMLLGMAIVVWKLPESLPRAQSCFTFLSGLLEEEGPSPTGSFLLCPDMAAWQEDSAGAPPLPRPPHVPQRGPRQRPFKAALPGVPSKAPGNSASRAGSVGGMLDPGTGTQTS